MWYKNSIKYNYYINFYFHSYNLYIGTFVVIVKIIITYLLLFIIIMFKWKIDLFMVKFFNLLQFIIITYIKIIMLITFEYNSLFYRNILLISMLCHLVSSLLVYLLWFFCFFFYFFKIIHNYVCFKNWVEEQDPHTYIFSLFQVFKK